MDELLPLTETWECPGLISLMDREKIKSESRTNRKYLNVNPEFSVSREWDPDTIIRLEEQEGLEAHIMDALAMALATWGEELEGH